MASSTHQGRFPDFLGIGVLRSGTTWLWQQLGKHPQGWSTPIKEINYFNRIYPLMEQGGTAGEVRAEIRTRLMKEHVNRFKADRIGKYLRAYNPRTISWCWRFYRGKQDLDWYRSLFAQAGERVVGDITPHYASISDPGVARIAETMPDVSVILILRDPVERDWSHAKLYLARMLGRPADTLTDEDYHGFFRNPSLRVRSDYLPMLENWGRYFSPDKFMVILFDDISTRPAELLQSIHRFLGLETGEGHMPPGLSERVNASRRAVIPDHLHRHLSDLHHPALVELAARFGGHAEAWLARAEESLAG